jgi:hypothetical protein
MIFSDNITQPQNPNSLVLIPTFENSLRDQIIMKKLEFQLDPTIQESEVFKTDELKDDKPENQTSEPKCENVINLPSNPLQIKLRPKFRQKFDFDQQKIVIERILLSGQQKAAEEVIRVKNQTKKELFPAVKETVQGIQKDLVSIHEQTFILKEKLVMAQHELIKIEKVLKIQCKAASKIDFYSNFIKPYKKPKKPKKNDMFNEYISMKEQLGCLKVLASEYQRDSEFALQGVVQVKNEILALNELHSTRISKLKAIYEDQELTVLDECRKIRSEFRRFKEFAQIELEAREILNKRQSDFITKLYQELGNTKFIIQNPRLRTQYHRKVTGKPEKKENPRNENFSLTLKPPETPESFSLAQTRPVTNDLKFVKDEDECFSIRLVTRFRNSSTPFK